MRQADKLLARWGKKEGDIVFAWPEGHGTKSDGRWLSEILSQEFVSELMSRGYDAATLRFSVEPKAGNHKFESQREMT